MSVEIILYDSPDDNIDSGFIFVGISRRYKSIIRTDHVTVIKAR